MQLHNVIRNDLCKEHEKEELGMKNRFHNSRRNGLYRCRIKQHSISATSFLFQIILCIIIVNLHY